MRMIHLKNVPVKATRKTHRRPGSFGSGILASRPSARLDGLLSDLDEIGELFARDDAELERELGRIAVDAAWAADENWYDQMANMRALEDAYEAGLSVADRCSLCNLPGLDLDPATNLCDRCTDRAIDASIAGENGRAGIGYHVF